MDNWMYYVQGSRTLSVLESVLTVDVSIVIIIAAMVLVLIAGAAGIMVLSLQRKAALKALRSKTDALSYMADHDSLTGLMNRSPFMEQLQQWMTESERPFVALMVLDVVNLRMINDAYSHDMGDHIMTYVAKLLKGSFLEDEVLIGINHTDFLIAYSGGNNVADVQGEAQRLIAGLSGGILVDHMEISVKVNIGIALSPEHSMDARLLFKKANMACMESERLGENRVSIFQCNIYKSALQRITLEKQLRRAIVKGEFEVYYQPRVDISTGGVHGCEALIRWNHPEGNVVYPGRFIGIAEKHGFISEITKWVVRSVIHQTVIWSERGQRIKVSFNISGKEFDDDFVRMMSQLLGEEQGDPSLLEVEITETATLEDMEYSKLLVGRLQNMGISVALDDFGTGYSSMTYIKKLNADKLKIDRSFIEDIDDYQQRVVVESMIELGKKLGYSINVEGVETEAQLNTLRTMTVDEVQGWYFSKAVKADAFYEYVLSHSVVVAER